MTWWRFTQPGGGKAWLDDQEPEGAFEALDGNEYPVWSIEAMGDAVRAALGIEACTVIGEPPGPVLYRPTVAFDGLTVTHVADPLHPETARTQVIQWATDTGAMIAGLNGDPDLPPKAHETIKAATRANFAELARLVEG